MQGKERGEQAAYHRDRARGLRARAPRGAAGAAAGESRSPASCLVSWWRRRRHRRRRRRPLSPGSRQQRSGSSGSSSQRDSCREERRASAGATCSRAGPLCRRAAWPCCRGGGGGDDVRCHLASEDPTSCSAVRHVSPQPEMKESLSIRKMSTLQQLRHYSKCNKLKLNRN